MFPNVSEIDFSKDKSGLVPVIIQNYISSKVLMLGYMDSEAYKLTIEKKKVHFFSRSKNRIWLKGESSGNYLFPESIHIDCDDDTILVQAIPQGPTCHRLTESCFDDFDSGFTNSLEKLIESRFYEEKDGSYVRSLYEKGLDKIAQKLGEEAVETVIASKNSDINDLINEASDLFFHFLILLKYKELSINDINKCLYQRRKE